MGAKERRAGEGAAVFFALVAIALWHCVSLLLADLAFHLELRPPERVRVHGGLVRFRDGVGDRGFMLSSSETPNTGASAPWRPVVSWATCRRQSKGATGRGKNHDVPRPGRTPTRGDHELS